MSQVIKGYAGNLVFGKGDFRIYGFHPNNDCLDKVIISKYGNITIKGELPELLQGKEYEIEVEYENGGKYESYNVIRILSNLSNMNVEETVSFLEGLVGEVTAKDILEAYPNFIKLMIDEKYDEIDLSKIKGVKEKRFNLIKEKINENVKFLDIMSYYKEYNLTMRQTRLLYERYSSFELLKQKMEENPYHCLCSVGGIGFKTADLKILSNNRSLATSMFRMTECMLHILTENEEKGNTRMSKNMLFKECSNITPECISHFDKSLKNGQIYYDGESDVVARKETYNCEVEIAQRINKLLNNPIVWDFDNSKYKCANGFELTEQQTKILDIIKETNICVLAGNAGSGKTMSCIALTDMLKDNNMSFLLFAPTGKASKVLNGYVGYETSTIHRGLGFNPECGFIHNQKNPLLCDVVIVDEASMIDIHLMKSLLRAINPDTTKLVFVCDPAQIPSVGCGNCIQDIINSGKVPVAYLDKVFRYKDGGLAKVATETRKGNKFLEENCEFNQQVFGNNKDFIFIEKSKESTQQEIVRVFDKLIHSGIEKDDIVVLSAYNKGEFGTYAINSLIQDQVNPYNGNQISYTRGNNEIKFRVGDRVMQTVNNYGIEDINGGEIDIFNGDEGYVIGIDVKKKTMLVNFDGNRVVYNGEKMSQLLLSYSISMHKSQGSQYKHVIVVTPPSHKFFLNRNLLYVGYTRAKEKVYNIGTADTINAALKKSDNLSRKTFLKNLL